MTRQVCYVFFGSGAGMGDCAREPAVMTMPLAMLALLCNAAGLIGTPAWPWFRAFLDGQAARSELHGFAESRIACS